MIRYVDIHFGLSRNGEPWEAEAVVRVRVERIRDGNEIDGSPAYDWQPGEADVSLEGSDTPSHFIRDYRQLAAIYGDWIVRAIHTAIDEGEMY